MHNKLFSIAIYCCDILIKNLPIRRKVNYASNGLLDVKSRIQQASIDK